MREQALASDRVRPRAHEHLGQHGRAVKHGGQERNGGVVAVARALNAAGVDQRRGDAHVVGAGKCEPERRVAQPVGLHRVRRVLWEQQLDHCRLVVGARDSEQRAPRQGLARVKRVGELPQHLEAAHGTEVARLDQPVGDLSGGHGREELLQHVGAVLLQRLQQSLVRGRDAVLGDDALGVAVLLHRSLEEVAGRRREEVAVQAVLQRRRVRLARDLDHGVLVDRSKVRQVGHELLDVGGGTAEREHARRGGLGAEPRSRLTEQPRGLLDAVRARHKVRLGPSHCSRQQRVKQRDVGHAVGPIGLDQALEALVIDAADGPCGAHGQLEQAPDVRVGRLRLLEHADCSID
eukprot:Unigene3002_Nuclearia_a/m.9227 Unigene3002_Nuclearia_a/g.9227  ORF Unigene3002_Nuclearia_a/g.9227 Unigene3002_Nuclearia_a/m.9227 type:complete len:349 (+) Unigene3002_Nuclearia_a:1280-2326(+)